MANTSVIYTHIDTELKKDAENILTQLGSLHPVQFKCFTAK